MNRRLNWTQDTPDLGDFAPDALDVPTGLMPQGTEIEYKDVTKTPAPNHKSAKGIPVSAKVERRQPKSDASHLDEM